MKAVNPENIRKIKDPFERALFEAGYRKYQQPDDGTTLAVFLTAIFLVSFSLFVVWLAIRTYRKNNPHPKLTIK